MSGGRKREIKGLSYLRVSTLGQIQDQYGNRRDDDSLDSQKNRCQRFIDAQNMKSDKKYVISEHIIDEALSGKNTKRPGYKKMWNLISLKKVNFIVCSELSRLSRNTKDFLDLIDHCKKHNVDLMIVGMNLDTTSVHGKMMASMFALLAEFEREMTSMRVKANAISRLIENGRINGASEILGLDKDPNKKGHFIPNDQELKVVEQIFRIYLKLSSKKQTLLKVQELGIKGKGGKELTRGSIGRIFDNSKWRYRGVWPLNKDNKEEDQETLSKEDRFQLIKLPHGPLIDIKLLDEVELKLKETQEKVKRSGKNYTYFLTTLLKHEDGSTWTGQPAKQRQYRYYYNKKNDIRISCEELDKLVIKRLKEYLVNSELFKNLIQSAYRERAKNLPTINQTIKDLKAKLAKVDEKEDAVKESLLGGERKGSESLMDWLESSVKEIQSNREKYEQELREALRTKEVIRSEFATDNIEGLIKKLLGQFSKLTGVQRRSIAEKIFEKIVIKPPSEVRLHVFDDLKIGGFKEKSSFLNRNGRSDWN